MRERILIICDGQGGGNVGAELSNMGFISYFINTSNVDLNTLTNVKDDCKFHIPNATGCNKDRNKAKMFVSEYYQHISSIIDKKYATQDIIFFAFSMAGGTGSGISPLLLDYMSRKNPKKHYGAIVILPSNTEPILALGNAVDCYNELSKIPNLKSVFMLDNAYGNKFAVNEKFATMFSQLTNICTADKRGVVDEAELENLLTCKGLSVMSFVDLVSISNRNYGECLPDIKIFAPYIKGCKYIGLYTKDDLTTDAMETVVGIPRDTYIGYNNEVNFMIATGIKLDESRIELMADICTKKEEARVCTEESSKTIQKPNLSDNSMKPQTEQEVDFDKLFNKYIG